MTNIEISARAKLLSMAVAIAEQYGEKEADWDILHIWRALEYGELDDYLSGILLIDTQDAAQTVHAAPHGSKVAALIDCASKALERSKAQPEALMRKGANLEGGTRDESHQRKLSHRNAD